MAVGNKNRSVLVFSPKSYSFQDIQSVSILVFTISAIFLQNPRYSTWIFSSKFPRNYSSDFLFKNCQVAGFTIPSWIQFMRFYTLIKIIQIIKISQWTQEQAGHIVYVGICIQSPLLWFYFSGLYQCKWYSYCLYFY